MSGAGGVEEGAAEGWIARARRQLLVRPDENFAALDGMRAIAALLVLLFHVGLLSGLFTPGSDVSREARVLRLAFNGTWGGVDIFFVLSGFLIGRMLILELRRDGALYYPAFFVRRSCRIFPAYYLTLAFSLLFCLLDLPLFTYLYGTRDSAELWRWSWTNFFYLVNYTNAPPTGHSIMPWAWSLAVEEHAYLLLPPLLYVVYTHLSAGARPLAILLCVVAPLFGRMVQFFANPEIPVVSAIYYRSHNRIDEIFVGVLVAYLYVEHREPLRRAVCQAGSSVGALAVVILAVPWIWGGILGGGFFSVVWQFTFLAVAAALFLLSGLFQENGLTRMLAHPFWFPIARVSYGVYLLNPFVVAVLLHAYYAVSGAAPGTAVLLLLVAATTVITVTIAALMYVAVEAPMMAWGAGMSRRLRERRHTRSLPA